VPSWVGQAKALAHRMRRSGIHVTDHDIILAITQGLPSSYQALVVSFDTVPDEVLTLKYVVTRLLNDSYRQQDNIASPSDSEDVEETALLAGNHEHITCFFCDEKGHIKADCSERKEWLAYKAK
ncbi:hypothetical protein SCHPADRAFT_791979, partial [Schizopora paradoxa]